MKKRWKKEIAAAFDPPRPRRKGEFLRRLPVGRIRDGEFLLTQLGYIRWQVWALDGALLLCALGLGGRLRGEGAGILAAFAPLLAISAAAESGRSDFYGMAELESATRFSLRSLLLARLGILGVSNAAALLLLIAVCAGRCPGGLPESALLVLCPYLLTCLCALRITRLLRGQEALYLAGGFALSLSVLLALPTPLTRLWQQTDKLWWLALAVLALALAVREHILMIQNAEVHVWN